MPSRFAEELRHRLDGLGNLQLQPGDRYDEQDFGNALVKFADGEVVVRFVRDRGIVTVEVGARDRFLSLDFLAFEHEWVTSDAIKQHYAQEDLEQTPAIDGNAGALYADLRQAIEDEGEDQVARIRCLLEPAHDEAAAADQRAALRGPYYGLCLQDEEPRAPADAVELLRERWGKIVTAVANEEWFPSACEREAAFWKSIGH